MFRYFRMLVLALMAMALSPEYAPQAFAQSVKETIAYIDGQSSACTEPHSVNSSNWPEFVINAVNDATSSNTIQIADSKWSMWNYEVGRVQIYTKLHIEDWYGKIGLISEFSLSDMIANVNVIAGGKYFRRGEDSCSFVSLSCGETNCIENSIFVLDEDDKHWRDSWGDRLFDTRIVRTSSVTVSIGDYRDETEHIERAIRHLIKEGGGKDDPFRE